MRTFVVILLVATIIVAASVGVVVFGRLRSGTNSTGTQSGATTGSTNSSTTQHQGPTVLMGSPDQASLSTSPTTGAVYKGVNYCDDGSDGGQQTLDIYYPTSNFGTSLPSVTWIHGGGWRSGDSSGIPLFFPKSGLLAKGFVVVSINYRLAPQYQFPAQVWDAECAIAFLRQNAAALDLNSSLIDIAGGSAGGHIASWVAVNKTALYHVNAIAVVSAPEDLTQYFGDSTYQTAVTTSAFPTQAQQTKGSPVLLVSAGDPPFLIQHGYIDTTVPYQVAVEMQQALQRVGVSVQLTLVQCAGHVLDTIPGCSPNPPMSVTTQQMLDFFVSHP